jgi:4-hydroxy-tetrahydrodipicolinate synthase
VKLNIIKNKIKGPIQTIFVPFNKDRKIDFKSLKNHIKNLCELDFVNVLYLMPYNGRYSQLTNSEILKLNSFCIKEVKKFKKIIIVSDPIHASSEEKLKFARHAKDKGADIFASICREKYFTDEQIYQHYKKISKAKIPLLVHVMPFLSGYTGDNIEWKMSTLTKLSKIKDIVAIKEDTKNLYYGKNFLKNFKKRFKIIFSGRKSLIYKLKDHGLESYLNGTSIIDQNIDRIFWFLINNDKKKSLKFIKEIDDPFWDILSKKYGWHRLNKCCLEINGIMPRYERLPMVSLSNREVKDVKKTINLIKKKLNYWKKLKIDE